MYDYEGLNKKLLERGLKKSELTSILKISSRTIAKIAKGEKLADQVMDKLCGYFSCDKAVCAAQSPLTPSSNGLEKKRSTGFPAVFTMSCKSA